MPRLEIDLEPVTSITTDAIGEPGDRTFYLQAKKGEQVVSLIMEKLQVQTLSMGANEFLEELAQRFPDLSPALGEYEEEKMHITPPVEPLFRVGEMGLAYDPQRDLVVLQLREVTSDDLSEEDAALARFWCTRSQFLALCAWGTEVAGRGRPICPLCGAPIDPAGHLCPKKNGHKH